MRWGGGRPGGKTEGEGIYGKELFYMGLQKLEYQVKILNYFLPNSFLPNSFLPNSFLPNSFLPNSFLPNSFLPIDGNG